MGCLAAFADFGRLMGSDAGEKKGPEREECAERWVGWQTSEVRRCSQESAQTRGNQRNSPEKNPNRERLGLVYWWRRRESNPRPSVLYKQIYILSQALWL